MLPRAHCNAVLLVTQRDILEDPCVRFKHTYYTCLPLIERQVQDHLHQPVVPLLALDLLGCLVPCPPYSTRNCNETHDDILRLKHVIRGAHKNTHTKIAGGGGQSGSGLQHTKLSKSLIEKAVGPEVMRAIASFKAGAAVGATQEGSAEAAEVSALSSLVGTEARGGALQVTISRVGKGGGGLLALLYCSS